MNERLRAAIFSSGMRVEDLAQRLGCDRKTVERWIDGHIPYRRNQYNVASILDVDPGYLWPPRSADEDRAFGHAELVNIWPTRSLVPTQAWADLFVKALDRIDVLVYAGLRLSQDPCIRDVLLEKSNAGVPVRFVLADPASAAVRHCDAEAGMPMGLSRMITEALRNHGQLMRTPNAGFRLHDTILYNSVFRSDDDMFVSTHIYGRPLDTLPLLHLHRVPGGQLFAAYAESFEKVWSEAKPLPLHLASFGEEIGRPAVPHHGSGRERSPSAGARAEISPDLSSASSASA